MRRWCFTFDGSVSAREDAGISAMADLATALGVIGFVDGRVVLPCTPKWFVDRLDLLRITLDEGVLVDVLGRGGCSVLGAGG